MRQQLTDKQYREFSELIYDIAGINLGESKKELLKGRLNKRLRELGIETYSEYYDLVIEKNSPEREHYINIISTNKTDFFREPRHFEFLLKVALPDLAQKRGSEKNLRIWSAACSTGEEPYTLAMTMLDFFEYRPEFSAKILATDISSRVLEIGKKGVYKNGGMKDITPERLKKYCMNGSGNMEGFFKMKKRLTDMIRFSHFNLLSPTYPFRKQFDFVFIRNVMIYFDKETQKKIISNIYHYMKPGGYIFLGHSESLMGMDVGLKYVEPTIYKKA